jgi:hypothetical protein
MVFKVADKTIDLKDPDDFVASSARLEPEIKIDDSDVAFVGYGIVAREYGWDDYKDVDVRGKTILLLINDPPIPDPKDSSKLDDKMFKGKAMTYYGRWTYKYEIAAEKGAAAAVIIHETEPAAYPYSVVKTSWAKENYEIDAPNKNIEAVEARSWITLDAAKEIAGRCGPDFDALKKSALTRRFARCHSTRKPASTSNNRFAHSNRTMSSASSMERSEITGPIRHLYGALGPSQA